MRFAMRKVPFAVLMFLHFSATLSGLCSPVGATDSVRVLSSTGYLDSSGNYWVVGEVQNVGSQAVNFVQVTATFYDSHNVVVDSRFDLTMLYVILVGRKSPFELALLDVAESARVSRYSLNVTYLEATEIPMKLEILSQSNYTDAEGNMHIGGNLRNLGDEKLVNAKVVATYYDALSQVVATASIGFDPDLIGDIDPYETVEFEIVLDKSRAQYVQGYALAAESNQYAMIPEFAHATDLNKDGLVDILDITIVAVAFGSRPEDPKWNMIADLNNDQVIDILDVVMVAKDFGKKV